MNLSVKNWSKNAPKHFVKFKKAVTFITDATIVILLGAGYSEDSLTLLILRVGVSAILNSLELFAADENATKK